MASIGKDITFRVAVKDETASGAAKARAELRAWGEEIQKDAAARNVAMKNNEIKAKQDVRKWEEESAKKPQPEQAAAKGGHDGGARHFGRIFSDASTTGLDTLSRGLLGGISEKLGTGLQLGVLAVAGATLDNLTGKAAEFSDQMRRGELDSAGVAVKLGESIPILESFVSTGQNIREILTGEKVELERIKEFTAEIEAGNERYFASSLRTLEVQKEQAETLRQMKDQEAGVGLRGSDSERHAIESRAKAAEAAKDIAIQKAKDSAATDPGAKAAQDALTAFRTKNGQRMTDLEYTSHNLDENTSKNAKKELAELEQQEGVLKAQAARQSGVRNKTKDDAIKAATDQAAESKKITDAEMAEFMKKRGERLKIEGETAAAAHERAVGGTAAENLRTGGNVYLAVQAEITARVEGEKAAARIDAEGRSNATTDAQEKAIIAARLAKQLTEIEDKGNADRFVAAKSFRIESAHAQYDTAQASNDTAVALMADELRAMGEGYQAKQELDERAHQKRLADIDQRANEEVARNQDHEKEIRSKALSDKAKEGADFKEHTRQNNEERRSGQFGTAKELISGRIDALQGEAKAGNIAAASEAKRLEIASQFAEKRERLNKMIRDPSVGQAEKDLAKGQLDGLDAQEARAKQLAYFTGGTSVPGMNISARGTGAASKAREEASSSVQLARLMQAGNKDASAIRKATEDMAKALKQNPDLAPLLKGVG